MGIERQQTTSLQQAHHIHVHLQHNRFENKQLNNIHVHVQEKNTHDITKKHTIFYSDHISKGRQLLRTNQL